MFRTGNKSDPAPEESPREAKEVWTPKEVTMQERTKQAPADGSLNALLGRGSQFDGKLTFEGTVRIDGTAKMETAGSNLVTLNRPHRESRDTVVASEAKS